MKVRELIEALTALDPDLLVDVEGCDCIGRASAVEVYTAGMFAANPGDQSALITRAEREQ